MRSIIITEPGAADVLKIVEKEKPVVGKDELLVKVCAFGLNRADIAQRLGRYPAPKGVPADVPGLEYAGEVEAVGGSVSKFKPGDRVFGLVGGGSYQEYLLVHAETAMPIPDSLSFAEAAAYPEAFVTAFDAMVLQGQLKPKQKVLISAVGSGVGLAAAQIAKLYRASSVGTSRTQDKLDRAKVLIGNGFQAIKCDKEANFARQVKEAVGEIDLFVELVGGSYVEEDIKCAAAKATIMLIGLLGGSMTELSLNLMLMKRLRLIGTSMRSRSLEEKIALTRRFESELLPFIAEKELQANLDCTMPFDQIVQAHKMMEADANFGKIVMVF
ncbi:MAG: NAD(P)H-quinone oxidoreductase [Candidatus Obscuribacterales bacterium]|nr:NAD(P)H-quinone oxidoreductase [Candidatus Obscuribacterales bacterium]